MVCQRIGCTDIIHKGSTLFLVSVRRAPFCQAQGPHSDRRGPGLWLVFFPPNPQLSSGEFFPMGIPGKSLVGRCLLSSLSTFPLASGRIRGSKWGLGQKPLPFLPSFPIKGTCPLGAVLAISPPTRSPKIAPLSFLYLWKVNLPLGRFCPWVFACYLLTKTPSWLFGTLSPVGKELPRTCPPIFHISF